MKNSTTPSLAVEVWLAVSMGLAAMGWVLSYFHALDQPALWVALGFLAPLAIAFALRERPSGIPRSRHFSRGLPLLFLLLVAVILAGGALYSPRNLEGLGYRLPRMQQWLQQGSWHWLHTRDVRLNNRGLLMEWLSLPLISLTRSDRPLFLINVASFALLPGLTFRVFRQFGVARWLCWLWMWTLPAGLCYATQAGSIGNDAFSTVYALAAVWYAGRFQRAGQPRDFGWSLCAAALMTGSKITNLPLLLIWIVALWPKSRLTLSRAQVVRASLLLPLAFAASFLPLAIANFRHLGDWTGLADGEFSSPGPLLGLGGNTFLLSIQNLAPPVFPGFETWNAWMLAFQKTPIGSSFNVFEAFGHLPSTAREEAAALGPALMLLVAVLLLACPRRKPTISTRSRRFLRWAPWLALVALLSKSAIMEIGRMGAPYYPFLLASLMAPLRPPSRPVRRLVQVAAGSAFLTALGTLAVSTYRPLLPTGRLTAALQARFPRSAFVRETARALARTPGPRADLAPLRRLLPASGARIGLISRGEYLTEGAIAYPLLRYQIRDFLPGESPAALRGEGIHYLVIDEPGVRGFRQPGFSGLLRFLGAREIAHITHRNDPADPFVHVWLVELLDTSDPAQAAR